MLETQERVGRRDEPGSPQAGRLRLLLLSFLMLLVELGLIRWAGSYVVYLSFFTNFVLLASFLGVGVGFLRAKARGDLFRWFGVPLALLLAFLAVFPVQGGKVQGHLQFVGGFGWSALPEWVALPVVFALAFATMACIAEGVARTFVRFEPLEAYRIDIGGSILGIVAFSVLSFLGAPPLVWGLLVLLISGAVTLRERGTRLRVGAPLVAAVVILGVLSFQPRTYWSPYYRVTISKPSADGAVDINVNGRPHQRIMPLSYMRQTQQFRFEPYAHSPGNPLNQVLIIGAGSGNDVDIALSMGAKHVDAVEIDPRLYQLGRDLHPDHPYQDPRVTVHVQDGRAFLHDSDQHYDLILYAIPDSLTVLAGQSSLRPESYLFTEEAMRETRDHLAPDGLVSMYHYYLPNVLDRYAGTLTAAFGHRPCFDQNPGAGPRPRAVLTESLQPNGLTCDNLWTPQSEAAAAPDTDDHPFPYLVERTIPGIYQVSLLLILAFALLVVRFTGGPFRAMASYADLFFMGAAFLLLETKNVVQFALLFGTTWFVNALVFAGILLTVFLAVEVARRWRPRRPVWLYAPLLAAVAVAWAVPPDALLGLSFAPRFLAAVGLAFAPVFLANLVFAERFRSVGSSTVAFGTNLLGAMVGGVLEYGALLVGYRALLIAVAVLYGLAFLTGRRQLGLAPAGASSA
jgi:Spermine/spermidine synthase domain